MFAAQTSIMLRKNASSASSWNTAYSSRLSVPRLRFSTCIRCSIAQLMPAASTDPFPARLGRVGLDDHTSLDPLDVGVAAFDPAVQDRHPDPPARTPAPRPFLGDL